jgi:hypothetical protein
LRGSQNLLDANGNIIPAAAYGQVALRDPFVWVMANNIQLASGPYEINGHWYQVDVLRCMARHQVAMKGAQIGFTELQVLRTLWGHVTGRYKQGSMYLFPTQDDVTDFSRARFEPLISANLAAIGAFVKAAGGKATDAVNIKRVGGSFLYLRGAKETRTIGGAKKSATKLKSAPVDRLVFDERDEMTDAMVELAYHRVAHSEVQEIFELGTPTVPDYGIHKQYLLSDQRAWMLRCDACGGYTCLEDNFPDCLTKTRVPHGGNKGKERVVRLCMKCRKRTVSPANGQWVARVPDAEIVGWHVSQLNSPFVDPGYILKKFIDPPNGDLSEVYNSMLGLPYIAAENRLTRSDILSCCGNDLMAEADEGPCAMGVDVGKHLHVVIGHHRGGTKTIVKLARVSTFEDLHDLAKRYNVRGAVIDAMPETRAVRAFADDEPFPVFLCYYSEHQKRGRQWNEESITVTANRTEVCDATHEIVTSPGKLVIPRWSEEVEQFSKEMCNIAKVLRTDDVTGDTQYRYIKTGPDHYRHATNYFEMACELVGAKTQPGRTGWGLGIAYNASWMGV